MPSREHILGSVRVLDLICTLAEQDGMDVYELESAGFGRPNVYVLLGILMENGLTRVDSHMVDTQRGRRFRGKFMLTDKGQKLALHLAEIRKLLPDEPRRQ